MDGRQKLKVEFQRRKLEAPSRRFNEVERCGKWDKFSVNQILIRVKARLAKA